MIPELFAPKIMNAEHGYHSTVIFSPDLTEAFWSPMERGDCLMHSIMINGTWTSPQVIDFGIELGVGDAAFSTDGNRLYFQTFQPPKAGDIERERIWFIERNADGWSEPGPIDDVILAHPTHWTFSFARNRNLYFTSEIEGVRGEQDIYIARFDGEKYLPPEDLGEAINSDGIDLAPYIAPDESYLIFTRRGKDTKKTDLFISFKKLDGSWTNAVDMGPKINTEHHDLCASLTPDGKYLFFISQRERMNGIYWVDVKIIEELKSKQLQISPNDVKLQILYDNNPYVDDLQTDPGFSCLIRIKNRTLLFDAGRIGEILMSNIEKLEINPEDIEKIVISHNNSDHICGLPVLLEECNKPEVYIAKAMANNVSDYAQELINSSITSAEEHASNIIKTTESLKICDNVYTTSVMGKRIPEQALIIQTNAGLIVITGCGHPGVVELTTKAKELFNQDVLLVLGGFHLTGKQPEDSQEVVTDLSNLTCYVAPCHCSGDAARELFKQKFGKNYIKAGVGKIINCGELTWSKKN